MIGCCIFLDSRALGWFLEPGGCKRCHPAIDFLVSYGCLSSGSKEMTDSKGHYFNENYHWLGPGSIFDSSSCILETTLKNRFFVESSATCFHHLPICCVSFVEASLLLMMIVPAVFGLFHLFKVFTSGRKTCWVWRPLPMVHPCDTT